MSISTICWILTTCPAFYSSPFMHYLRIPFILQELNNIICISLSYYMSFFTHAACFKILCSITLIKQDTLLPKVFKEAYSVYQTTFQNGELGNQHIKNTTKFCIANQISRSHGERSMVQALPCKTWLCH